jgi:hypothetical protein
VFDVGQQISCWITKQTYMSTVAEFSVAADAFPLGEIFERRPEIRLELDRVVPTGASMIPYCWVSNAERDGVLADFESLPGIEEIAAIDQVDGDILLRIVWDEDVESIITAFGETDVSLLSAQGTAEGWTVALRSEDVEDIAAFKTKAREHGTPIRITAIHSLAPIDHEHPFGLTESQREALLLAYERGYYETPKQTTLQELADELDITGQSLGSRLQRGTKHLLESTLVPGKVVEPPTDV